MAPHRLPALRMVCPMLRGLAAAVLFLAAPLAAQAPTLLPPPPPPVAKEEFQLRRAALAAAIAKANPGQPAVVLVRGGGKQADFGAFAQDQDFLYLSGISEPGLALLLVIGADGALLRDELLVPPTHRCRRRGTARSWHPAKRPQNARASAPRATCAASPRRSARCSRPTPVADGPRCTR
jgi:hypothetical protein